MQANASDNARVYQAGRDQYIYENSRPRTALDYVADQLAQSVQTRWRSEEEQRQVQDPLPLSVRWRLAPGALADAWKNVRRLSDGREEPLDLAGGLRAIVPIYQRIPSGRLVVLGRAGSGKTVLTMRFVLDMLADRHGPSPVPVIFSLGSWSPETASLDAWLTGQLLRDHPGLDAVGPDGRTLASALVGARRILPVLDGFDEIASGLHRRALHELSSTTMPLLLTSRPEEYEAAVRGRVLTSAAVVELTDLEPADLAAYLPRTDDRAVAPAEDGSAATGWQPVLDELLRHPEQPLAAVLTTPLMVFLARTSYSDTGDRDPAELLDAEKFADVEALEHHLLENFVATVYRYRPVDHPAGRRRQRTWSAEQAQRWLGYLAGHAKHRGDSDLAWWELGTSLRASSRTLVVAALAGLVFGVTTAVGNLPVDLIGTSHSVAFAIARSVVVGVLHGLVVGTGFGLMYWFAQRDEKLTASPVRIRLPRSGANRTGARFARRFALGVKCGLAVALALELVDISVVTRLGLDDGFSGGLLSSLLEFVPEVGLAAGLVLGLMGVLEAPIDVKTAVSPAGLLASNRDNAVFHLLVWALVLGPEMGLVAGLLAGPVRGLEVGLVVGLEGAFGAGLGYGLSLTAWGQWVALSRIWLPLTRRLPWAVVAFLDDAYRRGVLRQDGAVYQFRHARLQEYLTPAERR